MAAYIDLDDDKNNPSKDLTKKLIEKEIEKINKGQNIIKNMYSAADEALKATQSKATMPDTYIKEFEEKILQDNQKEMLELASMTRPMHFTPSKKSNNPPIVNNINITHSPLVFPEKKKKYYENLPGWIVIGIIGSLSAWLILRYFGLA